jgi:hypothetical protein
MPKIVFEATDGDGADLTVVVVSVDGTVLTERLDGSALAIDPGQHTFRFETAGQPALEKTYVISEGEQARHERIVLGSPTRPQLAAADAAPLARDARPASDAVTASDSTWSAQKTWALAAGGVGIAGVVVGTIFGLSASSKWSSAKTDCGTICPANSPAQAERSDAQSAAAVSTVAFIIGGLGLAGGGILWFTAPSRPTSAGALHVVPSVGVRSSAVTLEAAF